MTLPIPNPIPAPALDEECEHLLTRRWCAWCRKPVTSLPRTQATFTGKFCTDCRALIHKGDMVATVGRRLLCPLCPQS